MDKRAIRKTMAVALLAAVGGIARAQGGADPLAAADPGAYRKLDGVWQCHFLKTRNALEKGYYSNWTFDAAKKEMIVMWSPVHNGKQLAYNWDGKLLVLDHLSDGKRPNFARHAAELSGDGQLTIHDPNKRWKGWICNRAASERWPADGLQYLDYARYPWLSGSIEDGPSIMKYRDPKLYEEWLKDHLR